MDKIREIEEGNLLIIKNVWIHNGDLLVQTANDEALVRVAKFAIPCEAQPEKKARKPRTKKNGLAKPVLGNSSHEYDKHEAYEDDMK